MKNVLIAIILLTSLTTLAQDRKMRRDEFTPEQRVELHVKKMTLDLDLNDKQQKDVKKLLTEQNKKREAFQSKQQILKESGKKPTPEEQYQMRSALLDEKIAFKSELKKILSEKQMEKWEDIKADQREQMQNKNKNRHHQKREPSK
jgi:hypothetical protein